MHQQHVAGCKVRHQVFCAPPEPGHGLALKPCDKILLERKPQILAPGLGVYDFRALHRRLQAAADGFDFG